MEKVVLQIIKDSGRPAEHRVFAGAVVRIGRGFENELILSDPHVSLKHCLIRAHEYGYSIDDLGSLNGTWLIQHSQLKNAQEFSSKVKGQRTKVNERQRIYSGDVVEVGQTKIQFIVSTQPMADTLPMARPNAFFEEINRPLKAWLMVVCAIVLACVVEHQESYKNLPISKFFSIAIGLILSFLVWSGIWSFIGWLVKRRAFFNAHLTWGALFFIGMTLIYPLAAHLGYAASRDAVELFVGVFIFWIFITLLVAGHLMLATRITRQRLLKVAMGLSLVVIAFAVVTYYAGKPQFNAQPDIYGRILPPYAYWGRGVAVDQFIKQSNSIFHFSKDE